nr:beta-eliminating lyase-related protein [Cryptosporangium phraense]
MDECGAPEKVAGIKLLPVPGEHGKLTVDAIAGEARGFDDEHRAQPQVVSLTQSTELGTVYTPDEIGAIVEFAHGHGMRVHAAGIHDRRGSGRPLVRRHEERGAAR